MLGFGDKRACKQMAMIGSSLLGRLEKSQLITRVRLKDSEPRKRMQGTSIKLGCIICAERSRAFN